MMKIIAILSLFFASLVAVFGQQQTQYSQYMYSLFVINPAYAGNKDNLQGIVSERRQWTGIEGAPHSQSLIFHAPIKKQKMGVGLNVINESIGAHGILGAFGSYSYSLKLSNSTLSFGLRAGFYNFRISADRLNYRDGNDQSALNNLQSNFTPTFDAGLHYYNKRLMGGFTITNLVESQLTFASDNIIKNNLARHGFAYLGYLIDLSKKWRFQPSVMAKFSFSAPLNFDINTNFIYNSRIGLGVSYRSSGTVVGMAQIYLNKFFRMGYSYDFELSHSKKFNIGGSHELFVGFDFNRKNPGIVNPRYL